MSRRGGKRLPGLYPLKSAPTHKTLFGIDVETYDDNQKFLCASIVGDGYSKTFLSRDALREELLTNQIFRNSLIAATNLMFDYFAAFPDIIKAIKESQIIERHGDLVFVKIYIAFKYDGRFHAPSEIASIGSTGNFYPITFIDSIAHLKTSVSNLGSIISFKKLEHPDFFPNKPKNQEQWKELIEYNLRDSEITFKFMSWLQDWYNRLGCALKPTASSSAMDLFRRNFLGSKFWKQQDRDVIKDSYEAYYGGRVEAFKRGLFLSENWAKLNTYDVNSLYPFVLKTGVYPIPYVYRRAETISSTDIERGLGTGHFELKSPPDIEIPIIPLRTDKLRFPSGLIRGVYDFATIKYALNHGYELISAKNGIVYEHGFRPFRKYVDFLYAERMKLKAEKNPAEIICKLLMNSFYGKFGYNYTNKEMLMGNEAAMDEMFNHDAEIYPLDDTEQIFRVVKGDNAQIPPYVFPIYALMTTSYARIHMLNQYRMIGAKHLLYTDTDSIFTDRTISTSSELGEMKLEESWQKLCIVKPKMYSGILSDSMKNVIKLKGMLRITEDGASEKKDDEIYDFEDFMQKIAAGEFKFMSHPFRKLRGALHGKAMNGRYQLMKSMGLNDDKREWEKEDFTLDVQDSNPLRFNEESYERAKPVISTGKFEMPKPKYSIRFIRK
jgi:hypothetical protein